MKFPNTVPQNTYKAYITRGVDESTQIGIDAIDLGWNRNSPPSLRTICIQCIANDWSNRPVFQEIPTKEDQNLLLDLLQVDLPLVDLCANITADVFWRRCFQARWTNFCPHSVEPRPWISLYLERFLAERLESVRPNEWNEEDMLDILNVCNDHVHCLSIGQLQPAMDDDNDHIRIDLVLMRLPGLRSLELSYALKCIGTEFFLGCSNVSTRDVAWLSDGLESCKKMHEFRFHSTRLIPIHLRSIARSLRKSSAAIEILSFNHCGITDMGLVYFLRELRTDSFAHLMELLLVDNHITQIGAIQLAEIIYKRPIEILDLRLNPIGPMGAGSILRILGRIPVRILNLSGCQVDGSITDLIASVLSESLTLQDFNLSANAMGKDFGSTISQAVFAKQLLELDLRNTGIAPEDKCRIDCAVLSNRIKF